jgi:hypothetical protein
MTHQQNKQYNTIRAFITTLTTVVLLIACTSHPAENDLTGVWMREHEVLPDSTIVTYPNEIGQSFYKVYSDDGTYYLVYMQRQGDKEHLFPQHTATWEVRDGLYIECGDTMDATIHSADSMTVRWQGTTESWRRITDSERDHIAEVSRVEMIQQAKDMEAFLLALSRKEYAWRMKLLWWTIGAACVIALSFGIYGWLMRRKKKEIEERLHEIEQRNQLMPKKVADARAEVAADFFNSDYYVMLKQRIQDTGRLSTDEWQKMEEALRPIYPDFATTLRSFRISDVEYQVSLLLKLRIPLKDISTVMCKDATTISSIRSRLYQKVFQKKGGSRDWDDFIATL